MSSTFLINHIPNPFLAVKQHQYSAKEKGELKGIRKGKKKVIIRKDKKKGRVFLMSGNIQHRNKI